VANNPFFADATAAAALNAIAALANGGVINVYGGTQPADANTAVTSQTLLVTLTLANPAFVTITNPASNGSGTAPNRVETITANAIGSGTVPGTVVGTQTATWFRMLASGGAVVLDGSVGTSGCDLNLTSVSLSSGNVVSVSGFTITQPE